MVGLLGCCDCAGGCGHLAAHIRRNFMGWRAPLPGDFGEYFLDGQSSPEDVGNWVSRSAAYAMTDVPYEYDPETWGAWCGQCATERFMGVQVSNTWSYVEWEGDTPVIHQGSTVYDCLRKKELWFVDEQGFGRTGIKTEIYALVGGSTFYGATRNETTGFLEHTGTNSTFSDALVEFTAPRSTYSYDLYAALANPLGGTAVLKIENVTYQSQPAVKLTREIHDPVDISGAGDGSLIHVQVVKQEVLFYARWTFADFETWLNTMLDAVHLDEPAYLYPANTIWLGAAWNSAPMPLTWDRTFEPFYSSRENSWPNRLVIDSFCSTTSCEDEAPPWMLAVAIRHSVVSGLQLKRSFVGVQGTACLFSYEYEDPGCDSTAGKTYYDPCAGGNPYKTGLYVCEPGPGAGRHVFGSSDIAFENGILWLGRNVAGYFLNSPATNPYPCDRPLGTNDPSTDTSHAWPVTLDVNVFLEEKGIIQACCFPNWNYQP